MRALWLAGVIAVCAGCPAPKSLVICQVSERRFEQFLVAGEPARVTVGVAESCSGDGTETPHVADQVTVEVQDPDGKAVAFTVSRPMRTEGSFVFENTAVVSFTPSRPGSWVVSARFEPGIGRTQQLLEVAERRTDAGVRVVAVNLPADCLRYGITATGVAVCGRSLSQPELVTQRGERFKAAGFTMGASSIWIRETETLVARLVDDGMTMRASHHVQTEPSLDVMVEAGGDLWMFPSTPPTDARGLLQRAHPEPDGGITIESRVIPAFEQAQGLIAGPDAVYAYGRSEGTTYVVVSAFADGGVTRTIVPIGLSAGTDDTTFWIAAIGGLIAVRPGNPSVSGLLGTPSDLELPRDSAMLRPSSPVIPRVGPRLASVLGETPVVLPRFDGTAITLESYDVGAEYFPITNATRSQAFARSRDGKTLKIFER